MVKTKDALNEYKLGIQNSTQIRKVYSLLSR